MTTPTPAPTASRTDVVDRFVDRLVTLAEHEDRGSLAALRRSLGREPGAIAEACEIVEPFLHEKASAERVSAFYLVAGLFALHPVHAESERNLGSSLRTIRLREGGGEDLGVSRRLLAVLDARQEALGIHLRNLVTLLHGREPGAPIDFARLLRHISWWDHPDRFVQRAWAAGFWGLRANDDDTTPPVASQADDDDTDATTD